MPPKQTYEKLPSDLKVNLWLLLSSLVLAIIMPVVAGIYIAIVVSVGFALIPFTLFLGVPFVIITLAVVASYIVSLVLSQLYSKWGILKSNLLAFNVILTYLAFYYGLYYVLAGRDTFDNYSAAADPNYFGVSATLVSLGIFAFCLVSPVVYLFIIQHVKKLRLLVITIPIGLFLLNHYALFTGRDSENYEYPAEVLNISKAERKPEWLLVPTASYEDFTFRSCSVNEFELVLDCRFASAANKFDSLAMLMSENYPELAPYLYENGKCDMEGLEREIDRTNSFPVEQTDCSSVKTPGGREVIVAKNVDTISGFQNYIYFINNGTITLFSDNTSDSAIAKPERFQELLVYIDSFN